MRTWTKRDPVKNYFPLPNEIYQLGLSHGAIAVYGYLLRIEDRRTYQCHPSYATIGKAVGMSRNTVRKYVQELEERGLIRTERTSKMCIRDRFRFNRNALKLFIRAPEQVIPYLQNQFYFVKRRELEAEKQELNRKLERYAFDAKMDELTQKSLRLFRAELATRYHWRNNRRCFEKNDFRRNSAEFTREYPVVLSTTYSIKGTLSIEHIYDYLIVDEASQVDLATGVLAFSCARNIVIVGDLKQLSNVLTEDDIRTSDAIWQKYSLDERYRFSTHSLLSSALEIWQDAPATLLREHYRLSLIHICTFALELRKRLILRSLNGISSLLRGIGMCICPVTAEQDMTELA